MDNTRISDGYKSRVHSVRTGRVWFKSKEVLTGQDERIQNTLF